MDSILLSRATGNAAEVGASSYPYVVTSTEIELVLSVPIKPSLLVLTRGHLVKRVQIHMWDTRGA